MFKPRIGVRTRILVIAFVPSVALLGIGAGTAGYLYVESRNAHDWLAVLSRTTGMGAPLVDSFQQERMQSLWHETGQGDPAALAQARTEVDQSLRAVAPIQQMANANAYGKRNYASDGFNQLTTALPQLRGAIDADAMPIDNVYNIFNQVLDGIVTSSDAVVKDAPNTATSLQMVTGLRVLMTLESLSRSIALTGVVLNGETLSPALLADYRNQVGFYRTELPRLATQMSQSDAAVVKSIIASPSWQQLGAMEDYALRLPTTKSGAVLPPPVPLADWHSAGTDIGNRVLELWKAGSVQSNRAALDAVNRTSNNAALAGGGALAIAVAAFLIALVLANRLIGRLQLLRTQTLALAEEQLPNVTRRLAAGEQLNTETLSATLDFGTDEVGQVARAFTQAHNAAVDAAVTETRTREGVRAVFLNIAHRSQIVVHRLLEILDEAESRQEDPAMLDTLFRMDHLATRERRNAENLIILGGGQPGRQWRRPVPLVELVRSAVGETLDYARVQTARMPDTHVIGAVVADLIHLLAELVDNATAFSPPESRVSVTGAVVGRGVVVEISDQGMGMQVADMQRANEMLSNPPDFGVGSLSEDSRLGLFVVAQLAGRHGISVRLSESDYGGVRAIVLIPTTLVAAADSRVDHLPDRFTRIPDPPRTGEFPSLAGADRPAAPLTAGARPQAPYPLARNDSAPMRTGFATRPPLPHRSKQANLAPELSREWTSETTAPDQHTAEQTRDLFTAIDSGTRQGRGEISAPPAGEQDGEGDFFRRR
ncbi:nitrate- and nitrite sensing domain-containing protein [Nocardia sp. BMG111209]|uniref:sensor histidine kinase n=1 Tax=Nocardia sp. BMG111209 TaxID=1160137 RepID=UPI0003A7B65B|nr:nitrate- and nitrite sensing domain-containing protein [Nocardia sp. BMG111209]